MRLHSNLLALPTSILLLIATHPCGAYAAEEAQSLAPWPYNLPPHVKYWPEDPPNRRRDLEAIEEHLRLGKSPIGVMKMGEDEGEKFFMEYWQFEGNFEAQNIFEGSTLRAREGEERLSANASMSISYRPPFWLHIEADLSEYKELTARGVVSGREAAAALAMLQKRGFQCPSGIINPSLVVTTGITQPVSPTSSSIRTVDTTNTTPSTTNTGPQTTQACSTSFQACPVSLGGGCCPTDRVCAVGSCGTTSGTPQTSTSSSPASTTATTTTASGVAPVRPTSDTTTSAITTCPTGFYACDAYYAGGCCRTGRNCDTISCPASSSTTIISSGVMVVVPVGSAATTASPSVCCIYHAPRDIDESSDESSSDSDSSDSGNDDGAARPVGRKKDCGHDYDHNHDRGTGKGTKGKKRDRSPNAYEKQPKVKGGGATDSGNNNQPYFPFASQTGSQNPSFTTPLVPPLTRDSTSFFPPIFPTTNPSGPSIKPAKPQSTTMPRSDEAQAFYHAVYSAIQEIPYGKVTSYGHIALLIGTPQRPRQVGICLKHLPSSTTTTTASNADDDPDPNPAEARFHDANVPWQRVISAKGTISPRNHPSGAANQASALRAEGITVTTSAMGELMVDFREYGWFPRVLPSDIAAGVEDLDEEEDGS
ncbi:hypothetical protein B7494_g6977 [Chlorociboria aeruginascens]|nr:hypothetical protein B7494_g6977 [Chlorociboria aeruginascens]